MTEREDGPRLAALARYAILDTAPEASFDEVAALAAAICEAPMALVSLVDEHRQFFKAEVGLGVRETPIETSFCAVALRERAELFVVADAATDPRFADNPLVTGPPHLRFYAGAPLRTADGVAIGTLCVLDRRPRVLTRNQEQAIGVLARQVMAQLDLRLALRTQSEAEARLRASEEAGRIGTFELDIASDTLRVTPEFCRLFGLPPTTVLPARTVEALVIAEDRRFGSTAEERRRAKFEAEAEYRIRHPQTGALHWILRQARVVRDDSGRARSIVGTVQDITRRRVAEARTAALLRLGDALRDTTSLAQAAEAAASCLAGSLAIGRAGYARMVPGTARLEVAGEWTAPGIAGLGAMALAEADAARLANGATDVDEAVLAADMAEIVVPLSRRGLLTGLVYAHAAQGRPWNASELAFARAVADRTEAAVARLRAEADQKLLNEELSHRLKNTLAMVQALAQRTLRDVVDRSAVAALDQRIVALSAAHDILLRTSWTGASLATVAERVLRLHAGPDRLTVDGPDVSLASRAALSVSLLLHELATNAVKYGALSNASGRVALTWTVADGRLLLTWRETGGPPTSLPSRSGFGSRLIGMGLVGTGEARIDYNELGLVADFTAPISLLEQD